MRFQRDFIGSEAARNRLWLLTFVWHTRIVKDARRSLPRRIARRAIGPVLYGLAKALPFPPAADLRPTEPVQPIPKIIWMYWHDGEAAAPSLARYCISSWRIHNPDWEVRVLDSSTTSDYVDIDYLPAGTRLQLVADALRLELLDRYGGVWADVSCLCTGPLDDWLVDRLGRGFFAFERPGPDRPLSNWFLASQPGNPLVASWVEMSRLYWRNGFYSNHVGGGRRDQFIYHYFFRWMVNADTQLRGEWLSVPRLPAGPPHLLQKCLRDLSGLPSWWLPGATWRGIEIGFDQLDRAASQSLMTDILSSPDVRVHKLDWRLENAVQILSMTAGAEQSVDPSDVP